ncbi:hypothetical protein Cgig2_003601 [Carnegiea gigantea]|uniref:Uncharacterized protein n=1 Tax=Carnegiea gigantea TaxID=171969 RepID=A0A9Q1GW58_9CARY|nr:hypothetical protein Cgig2_003601 [Carnegiea gigantea]
MLLNDVVKLSVLRGWMMGETESTLKELRWSTFQVWVGRNRGRILEACRQEALNTSENKESRKTRRARGQTTKPLLHFTLPDAEEAAHDFNILEIVQATFHAMLLNNAVRLSLVSRDMARGLKSTLQGLQWTTFELLINDSKRALLDVQLRKRIPLEGDPGPLGGEEKSSALNEPPPPSSDE